MKKHLLAVFIFSFFLPFKSISQNKFLDSLILEYRKLPEDTTKLKLTGKIFKQLINKNLKEAKKYADTQFILSKKLKHKKGEADSNHNLGSYFYYTGQLDSARTFHQKANKIFSSLNLLKDKALSNHAIAILDLATGQSDKALKLASENIKIFSNLKDSVNLGRIYNFYADVHQQKGNYEIAYENVLKSLSIFNVINEPVYKAQALHLLASLESNSENYKKANEYAIEAYKIYKSLGDKLFQSLEANSIGHSSFLLNDMENAISYLSISIDLAKEMKHKVLLGIATRNLGRVYVKTGNHEKGIELLEQALIIHEQAKRPVQHIRTLYFVGEVFNDSNQPQKALVYYNKGINIAKTINGTSFLPDLLKGKSLSLEQLGNYKEAYKNLFKSKKISDSIFTAKKAKQIEELKTIYETEKKEAQIALQNETIKTLNVQAKNDQLTKTLYSVGMFSFLAIASLIYFGFKQRIRKNKIEREKQETILKQEIAFKKKELASQTLHLVQKSTFIQELKENLEKIKKSPELFKVEFRRLVMLLKKESAEDKDWEIFKSYFSEVHNNFDNKLKAIYADITEKEIRLASFLRMNLSTKEIASMLNVLPESVLKSKYRLKKKLNLDKETDLNTFLNSL